MTDTNRTAMLLQSLLPYSPQFHRRNGIVVVTLTVQDTGIMGRTTYPDFAGADETAAMEAAAVWLGQTERGSHAAATE